MDKFTFFCPTKIAFGGGSIAELDRLVPAGVRVLVTYGGGSIKKNGVYEQVMAALGGRQVTEFGGIEPNPRFETLMRAVLRARHEGVGFLLAVGGGSVLDGTKFVAAAARFEGEHPWDILAKGAPVTSAIPLGCVMTLPATGSEMNAMAVVSREDTQEKLFFASDHVRPQFSVLDPEVTYSLPPRQVGNGVVDTFVHVTEQYLTQPAAAPLQDRQSEAILRTLVEEAPKALLTPRDYDVRATLMWCATNALNGLVGCGVPQDWSTHMIGHELTALYGLDHAQTLAVVLPGVLRHERALKQAKLLQFAARVWDLDAGSADGRVEQAIAKTEQFFQAMGVATTLDAYGVGAEACGHVADRFAARNLRTGEQKQIGPDEVREILSSRLTPEKR